MVPKRYAVVDLWMLELCKGADFGVAAEGWKEIVTMCLEGKIKYR